MQSGNAEKLVGLDNLSAHCHPDFRWYAKHETNSLLIYTPEDCTDLCAVTDAGLEKAIKDRMRAKFDAHYESNEDMWDDGKVSAAGHRALLVQWLSEAWEEFFAEGGEKRVLLAFQRCGMLNAVDGSEDHLIKVQNTTDYDMNEGADDDVDDSDATETDDETDDDSSL